MKLKIVVERIVLGTGGAGYKIIEIQAKPADQVPAEYSGNNNYPWCWGSGGKIFCNYSLKDGGEIFNVGEEISPQKWFDLQEFFAKCADRLRDINIVRDKLSAQWNGEEVFEV